MYFETLPDYLKETVSGIELYRRTNPGLITILLSVLPYQPSVESYPTLHTCLRKLAKLKKLTSTLEKLKKYFAFDVVQIEGDWKVTLLQREPIPEITPLGKLVDQIDRFDQKTNDTDRQPRETSSVVRQDESLKQWS